MSSNSYLLAIVLVCLAIFFPHLDVVEVNIMEARNFISAREMLQFDNWLHTTMNLEPRYEKPPLPTWLTAASASIFGLENLVALRLPAALSATFLIFSFYFFSLKLGLVKKQAFVASLILSTSFYIIFSGRNGQWDIFAHAFMFFAIFKLFAAFETNSKDWTSWILAGIFLGFSTMSKGPVSFFALLLPFLIAYGIVFRFKNFKPKIIPMLSCLVLFAVVGLSWGLYIYITDTSTAEFIANKETRSWANREVKPFYHYWSFFIQSGAWAYFSLIGLLYPFMIKRVTDKKLYVFSLIWTLSTVVLLSMVPEKKERYLLPVLIPMALNTSFYINYLLEKSKELPKIDRYLANFGFGLIGVVGLVFPFGVYQFFKGELDPHWVAFFLSSFTLFFIGILIFYWIRKKAYEKCFYGMVLLLCSIVLFAFPMADLLTDNEKYLSAGTTREIEGMKGLELYCTDRIISPEIIYDLGETVKRIKSSDQLPQEGKFGLLAYQTIPEEIKQEFDMEFIAQFDINRRHDEDRNPHSRLTSKLFILEKK